MFKKILIGLTALIGFASQASAAVAFDSATQSFSGTFDLTPYYSAIGIIVVAIAVIAGIRLALRSFKSV